MGHETNVVVVSIQSENRKRQFTVFGLEVHNNNIHLVSHPVELGTYIFELCTKLNG